MKKLSLLTVLGLALVITAGAFSVQAAPVIPTPSPIQPSFHDGRINAYDPGAPVAVFETRKSVPIVDSNGLPTTADVVNGVQLLFWDGASAKQVLDVSLDQINAAVNQINGVKTTASSTSLTTIANSANNANTSSSTTSTSNSSSSSSNNSSANTTNGTANTTNSAAATTSTSNKAVTTKFAMNGDSIVIAKSNGYTLNYSKTGYFWISTPPDFEGKVYTFSWQKDF
jgi:hypothetical protein